VHLHAVEVNDVMVVDELRREQQLDAVEIKALVQLLRDCQDPRDVRCAAAHER